MYTSQQIITVSTVKMCQIWLPGPWPYSSQYDAVVILSVISGGAPRLQQYKEREKLGAGQGD